MGGEGDLQVSSDAEFRTHEEADAFQRYIDSADEDEVRNIGDEALVRNGWLAARDYFDRPVEGGFAQNKPRDAMISASDFGLRREALDLAIRSGSTFKDNNEQTVARAEAFLLFLQGGAK